MSSTSSSFLSSLSAAFAVGMYFAMGAQSGAEKNGRRAPRASNVRNASNDGYPSPTRGASNTDDDDAAASTNSRYTRNYGSARKATSRG